jgi:hypothetical protein
VVRKFDGSNLEDEVGALQIAFNQACNQTYTQFGYPGEAPYDGELLYSHVSGYAGADTSLHFAPEPIKIASDFTQGASGGPWTISGPNGLPTVVSLTDYGYENQPGYLYGAYFGAAASKAYELAARKAVSPGIEDACKPLPKPSPPPEPSTPTQPTPLPSTPSPSKAKVTLKVKKVHRRADGSAIVITKVGAAGKLKLSGSAVRLDSLRAPAAGRYKLIVAPRGAASRRLRQDGGAKVGVRIVLKASGTVARVSKSIRLSRH